MSLVLVSLSVVGSSQRALEIPYDALREALSHRFLADNCDFEEEE